MSEGLSFEARVYSLADAVRFHVSGGDESKLMRPAIDLYENNASDAEGEGGHDASAYVTQLGEAALLRYES